MGYTPSGIPTKSKACAWYEKPAGAGLSDTALDETVVFAGIRATYPEPQKLVGRQVIVVADGNVRWDHLVNGFNAALVARFKNISFGTQ